MELHNLKPTLGSKKTKHRKGRGHAAGKGKQAGKGQSGQKKRGEVRLGFEGGQNPWFRRLPKRGFNNINKVEYQTISLSDLENAYNNGDEVTLESLLAKKIARNKNLPVKLLANGKLAKALIVKVNAASVAAKTAVEAVGGKVEVH